jgi:hypothetical protein
VDSDQYIEKYRLEFCRITGLHRAEHGPYAPYADSPTSNLALRGMPSASTIEEKCCVLTEINLGSGG